MKLVTLLNENAMLAYRDLDDIQLTVLRRLATGKVDAETASPREQAIMDQLADLGLVDSMSYEPNESGLKVADLVQRYGSRDARQVHNKMQKLGATDFGAPRKFTDVGDTGEDIGNDDEVAPVRLKSIAGVRPEYNA
jgi:hypothetical protein